MKGILDGTAKKRKTEETGINAIKRKSNHKKSHLKNQRRQCCSVLNVEDTTISSR